ncbi:MAG: hypothetical protein OXJ36_03455 [bacterium]|nr:hypothetical protein [bacterium]MDE0437441.1 hypothetical protein [bacterium]
MAFRVLSVSYSTDPGLGAAVDDLIAAWQRFRSLDGHKGHRAGTGCFAWALEVTVGASGPCPRLNCFLMRRSPQDSPGSEDDRAAHLWRRAVQATAEHPVSETHVTHEYLPQRRPAFGIAQYATGVPSQFPHDAEQESRLARTHQRGSTLLDVALDAHLRDDPYAGRLLADIAAQLAGRRCYSESATWKRVALQIKAGKVDTETIFTKVLSCKPSPVYTIASSDYFEFKSVIENWCASTARPSLDDFRTGFETLADDYGIEPIP